MKFTKSIQETDIQTLLSSYEQELKEAKKKYEKLLKQMKKARSEYHYYNLSDEAEVLYEDIAELQMTITDLRKQKKLAEIDAF
jgi:predicted  nucleic acid-binding Zn-ribbon protein